MEKFIGGMREGFRSKKEEGCTSQISKFHFFGMHVSRAQFCKPLAAGPGRLALDQAMCSKHFPARGARLTEHMSGPGARDPAHPSWRLPVPRAALGLHHGPETFLGGTLCRQR